MVAVVNHHLGPHELPRLSERGSQCRRVECRLDHRGPLRSWCWGYLCWSRGGADGLSLEPLNPAHAPLAAILQVAIMWAALVFVGFEATAVYRREAKNPDKTVPRATYGAVFLLGILYVFTSLYMAPV